MKTFLISGVSPTRSNSDAQTTFLLCLCHFSTLGFWVLPGHGFPTSRWETNRRLICGKLLMGWVWKQHKHVCPHFTDPRTQCSLTVAPKHKGAGVPGLTVCQGKEKTHLVSSWWVFTIINRRQRLVCVGENGCVREERVGKHLPQGLLQ